ncbi:unnamed protein product [Dimorphilus gyrociliatus]|uniref:Cadherin domain-containing protein n=1 Tax=Dimorphilus gyrociliatus TaxID=2664684 RepID=A0A7I8VV80_9ANNE|nr:unnamed protein product [Dimorphilus gyrociliatus]
MYCVRFLLLSTLYTSVSASLNSKLNYEILEEIAINKTICNVFQDAQVGSTFTNEQLKTLWFEFLPKSQRDYSHLFSISSNGIVRVRSRIDRDEICPGAVSCSIEVDVGIQPKSIFRVVQLYILIKDLNDNRPSFDAVVYRLNVLEHTMKAIDLTPANDPDSPQYGVGRYDLRSPNNAFELYRTADVLQLKVNRELDREKRDKYTLELIAYDAATNNNPGKAILEIIIDDANDHPPVFDNSTYQVYLSENSEINEPFLTVRASDKDVGDNGKITYSLSTVSNKHASTFGVNGQKGELYLKRRLNFEERSYYSLTILAKDSGLSGQAVVKVNVLDTNAHSPKITVNAMTDDGVGQVFENTTTGEFVAHISVADGDKGAEGSVSCSLQPDAAPFALDFLVRNQYKIITTKVLDREETELYNIRIECQDGGKPPLRASKSLTVRIKDKNDNSPVFDRPIYSVHVKENIVKENLLRVHATDADSNSNVSYGLQMPSSYFVMDGTTGMLHLRKPLDRERQDVYRIIVIASDKDDDLVLSSSCKVEIILDDVNDEIPAFTKSIYYFKVDEDIQAGKEIGFVSAEDKDAQVKSLIFYEFRERSDKFGIDPLTGRIWTKGNLDRETIAAYQLTVVAREQDMPTHKSSVNVKIDVLDANDNFPHFLFPSKANNSVSISNKIPIGHKITSVKAIDMDLGRNSNLTYHLLKSATNAPFDINSETGSISTNKELDDIQYEVFEIRIQAKDSGIIPLTSKITSLYVIVNKSIPFENFAKSNDLLKGQNLSVIIAVVVCSVLLITVLISAIIMTRKRSNKPPSPEISIATYDPEVQENVTTSISQSDSSSSNSYGKTEWKKTSNLLNPSHLTNGHQYFINNAKTDNRNASSSYYHQLRHCKEVSSFYYYSHYYVLLNYLPKENN